MNMINKTRILIICSLALLDLSSTFAQRVTMPPGMSSRLSLSPSDRTVKKFIGDTYVLSCLNGSSDTEWQNPQSEKVNNTKLSRVRQQPRRGGGGIDLFLTRITAEDAGMYTCRSKSTTVSFNLIVVRPIAFDNSLAYQTAIEGLSYTIKCTAQGQSNTPKLYWKVDQKSPQGPKYKVVKDGLIVNNVTREDSKKSYVCHAMDIDSPMPDSKLMSISLHVTRKPITSTEKNATVAWAVLGEWASLSCRMDAEPIPTFEWFNPANQKLSFSNELSIINDINDADYTSTLQVLMSTEDKFGNYTCRARNDMGVTDQIFILQKGNRPTTPFLEIDMVTANEVRIRVRQFKPPPGEEVSSRATPDLPIIEQMVEIKLATDTLWFPAKVKPYEEGFVLQGLQSTTTYHVRAALRNSATIGHYSPPIQVGTSDPTPSPPSPTQVLPEKEAEDHLCSEDQFKCKAQRYCIPLRWKCDSEPDCSDSSDEDKELCQVIIHPQAEPQHHPQPEPQVIIEKIDTPIASSSNSPIPLFSSPSSRLLYITRNNNNNYNNHNHNNNIISLNNSNSSSIKNTNANIQEQDEQEPQTSSTNQTSMTVTSTANNTRITTTTNVAATTVRTITYSGTTKVITTRKEETTVEKIETTEL